MTLYFMPKENPPPKTTHVNQQSILYEFRAIIKYFTPLFKVFKNLSHQLNLISSTHNIVLLH